eukprot:542384_1
MIIHNALHGIEVKMMRRKRMVWNWLRLLRTIRFVLLVDGTQQKSVNDVLSAAPPVNSIDVICKCNEQIINGVKTLMKDVRDDGRRSRDDKNVRNFVYSS